MHSAQFRKFTFTKSLVFKQTFLSGIRLVFIIDNFNLQGNNFELIFSISLWSAFRETFPSQIR